MAGIQEHLFDVEAAKRRLQADSGGYEIVHTSPGLEVGVYVLVAPEPDRQQPHEDDEVYVVLEGRGTLRVEDEEIDLEEGQAMFVAVTSPWPTGRIARVGPLRPEDEKTSP